MVFGLGGGSTPTGYQGSASKWSLTGSSAPLSYGAGSSAAVVVNSLNLVAQPILGGQALLVAPGNGGTPWVVGSDSGGCSGPTCPATPALLFISDNGSGNPGRLDAVALDGAGPVWTMTNVPSPFTAVLLRRDNKVLYLTSGNAVYAIATESPGLGTQAGGANETAWPARNRDACNSRNLAYHCPY